MMMRTYLVGHHLQRLGTGLGHRYGILSVKPVFFEFYLTFITFIASCGKVGRGVGRRVVVLEGKERRDLKIFVCEHKSTVWCNKQV